MRQRLAVELPRLVRRDGEHAPLRVDDHRAVHPSCAEAHALRDPAVFVEQRRLAFEHAGPEARLLHDAARVVADDDLAVRRLRPARLPVLAALDLFLSLRHFSFPQK